MRIIITACLACSIMHAQVLRPILFGGSGLPQAATPTFSPSSGAPPQTVTISASSGGVICYNTSGSPATNGTTGCTTGTLYTGTVSVSTPETLYAVSGGTGYKDSAVGSAAYTSLGATSNNAQCYYESSNPAHCSLPSTPTVGHTVLVGVYIPGSYTASSFTDNQSPPNTYTLVSSITGVNSTNALYIYAGYVATASGTFTVDFTLSTSFNPTYISVGEYTGLSNPVNVDKVATGVYNSAGNSCNPTATGTTSNANDLIYSFIRYNSASTITADTGYTIPTNGKSVVTGSIQVGSEYQVVSSTGSYTPGYTLGASGGAYCAGAAIY